MRVFIPKNHHTLSQNVSFLTPSSTKSYGPRVNTSEAREFLLRLFSAPADEVPPVCLWGKHGIGKTALINDLATDKGCPLITISPAQFEEMGDLLGLPYLDNGAEEGHPRSRFAPPEWVPQSEGPGILLIDDFNRADDRILRGLMALWQERRLSSWALPQHWFIVLTANPEGEFYSVTPVDEASLTRMLHLQVHFDVHSWAVWAHREALPAEAIDFVLQHPEVIDGQRTTARTLTFFFRLWQQYGMPSADDPHLRLLLQSSVQDHAAQQFLAFLQDQQFELPDAPTLLRQPLKQSQALFETLLASTPPRQDLLSLLMSRLLVYLERQQELNTEAQNQLSELLLLPSLPPEQVLLLLHSLSKRQHPVLGSLMRKPELARLLLQ